jgi:5-methylcytosine-specific restriction endonuclease McrA
MRDLLYNLYVIQQLSTRDIAKQLVLSQTTVRRRLAKYGIDTRKHKDSKNTDFYKNKMQPYWESLMVRENRSCAYCGKEFEIQPHMDKKYCSEGCVKLSVSLQKTNRYKVECSNCGEILYRTKWRIDNSNHQFCNRKCLGEWKSKQPIHRNEIGRFCANCGEFILVTRWRNKREKVYCSTECMGEHYSNNGLFSGKNSGAWKGGKISRTQYGENWFKQRRKTRKRDGYKCTRCGKSELENGEELSIHHIINFKEFESYLQANELSNLVGLCRECHTFVHSSENVKGEYIMTQRSE